MDKDIFSKLIPIILGLALLFVKVFVLVMVVLGVLVLYVIPQSTPVIAQNSLPGITPQISTPTLSPEDAAIANSEWSGARVIKTAIPASTPFIVPTMLPTPAPIVNPSTDNVTQLAPSPQTVISSPLEGFGIGDLTELISQVFKVPPPGEDSGHHGVDFAFWNRGNKPILGNPIKSVFAGKIAMSDPQEKPPYGYALMIETPLETIPQTLIHAINIPTQPIGTTINNKLNCPDLSKDQWNSTSKSLYTLYGHMISAPGFKVGEAIQIGQTIGFVGNSGYSSAAHLHLEMRIGPSGASFSNMGHYDPVTTEEDRHNYCNWRVSGVFQMFDPMDLFKTSLVTK